MLRTVVTTDFCENRNIGVGIDGLRFRKRQKQTEQGVKSITVSHCKAPKPFTSLESRKSASATSSLFVISSRDRKNAKNDDAEQSDANEMFFSKSGIKSLENPFVFHVKQKNVPLCQLRIKDGAFVSLSGADAAFFSFFCVPFLTCVRYGGFAVSCSLPRQRVLGFCLGRFGYLRSSLYFVSVFVALMTFGNAAALMDGVLSLLN